MEVVEAALSARRWWRGSRETYRINEKPLHAQLLMATRERACRRA